MTNRERQVLICGLICIHLAVGPLLNYFGSSASPWESHLDYAILAGQISVLGIWTAYSGPTMNRRVGLALLGLAYVWFWMMQYWSFPATHALGVFAQWLMVVALLLAWRAFSRSPGDQPALPRFGVRELLLWTAMAGAILTFAKWLGAAPRQEITELGASSLPRMAVGLASYAAVGLVGVWIGSGSRRPLLKLVVLLIVAFVGTVGSLRIQALSTAAIYSLPMVLSGLVVVCSVLAMRWLHCLEPQAATLQAPAIAEP